MGRRLERLQPLRLALRLCSMLLLWSEWCPLQLCVSFNACSLACTLRTALGLLVVLRLRLRLMVLLILKLQLALWCLVVVVVVGRGLSRLRRRLDGQGLIC